jgi:hypothetical protein
VRSTAPPDHDAGGALLARSFGRRSLLRASASGIGLLAIGALLPAGCRSYPEPPVALGFFTAQEYAVFQAVARAILGLEDDAFDVAAEVDRLVVRMDRRVRRDIRWILRIFEHGTHLFDLKGPRFTRLDRDDQEDYLRGWMMSSLGARRLVFRGLKLLASLGYYGSEATWSRIGYAGPWLGRVEAAPLREPEKPVPLERLESA